MRELHVYDCALMGCTSLRLVFAAALIAGSLLVTWAPARADPETCPPTCDQIPATAWISREAIPLYSTYHWPTPGGPGAAATVLTGAATPRFRFEEVCATPPFPQDTRNSAVASRVVVEKPAGQWQLRAEILHWRGDTARGGPVAMSVFGLVAPALRACQLGAATESPSLTVDEPTRLAAVISGPVIAHTYFVAHPESSTISELTLWGADPVQPPWPIISDAQVLDAMTSPVCAAYIGSC